MSQLDTMAQTIQADFEARNDARNAAIGRSRELIPVWFRVTAWRRTAEVCNQYLQKGRQVLIEGRLKPDENGAPRVWTGNDGVARASYEVTAETVRFLGGRGEGAPVGEPDSLEEPPDDAEEEIPF